MTTAHSAAMACPSRPSTRPRAAIEATQTDRSTDASGPTSTTMVPRTRIVAPTRRGLRAGRRRLRVARMMTMWEPDTAVRCVREVAVMASSRSEGISRSSPMDIPGTSPRASRGRVWHASVKARCVSRLQASSPPGRSTSRALRARIAPTDGASAANVVSRLPSSSYTSPRAASRHEGALTRAVAPEVSHRCPTETARIVTRARRLVEKPDEAGAGSRIRSTFAWMGPEPVRAGSAR